MPWASIMPTGGVTPDESDLKLRFDVGVTCMGLGSKLFLKEVQDVKDYGFIK